jgi:hydrogenase maturation protease
MTQLVLGLGNPLSGADAFGPAVIDRLRGATDLPPGVDLADAHCDLLAHLGRFDGVDTVVLVDSVIGPEGSTLAVIPEPIFSDWDDRSHGAHELSAIAAVKLFRVLQTRSRCENRGPIITLVARFIREEDFGQPLTAEQVDAGAAAVRQLLLQRTR